MRECVRSTEILARVGGDEFALLMPHADETSAKAVLERVKLRVTAAVRPAAPALAFSIGGVTFRESPQDVVGLLSEADALMFEAKALGKNTIVVRATSPAPSRPNAATSAPSHLRGGSAC
jgi:diguanylate cyclase (GGDEF)-like protein